MINGIESCPHVYCIFEWELFFFYYTGNKLTALRLNLSWFDGTGSFVVNVRRRALSGCYLVDKYSADVIYWWGEEDARYEFGSDAVGSREMGRTFSPEPWDSSPMFHWLLLLLTLVWWASRSHRVAQKLFFWHQTTGIYIHFFPIDVWWRPVSRILQWTTNGFITLTDFLMMVLSMIPHFRLADQEKKSWFKIYNFHNERLTEKKNWYLQEAFFYSLLINSCRFKLPKQKWMTNWMNINVNNIYDN